MQLFGCKIFPDLFCGWGPYRVLCQPPEDGMEVTASVYELSVNFSIFAAILAQTSVTKTV